MELPDFCLELISGRYEPTGTTPLVDPAVRRIDLAAGESSLPGAELIYSPYVQSPPDETELRRLADLCEGLRHPPDESLSPVLEYRTGYHGTALLAHRPDFPSTSDVLRETGTVGSAMAGVLMGRLCTALDAAVASGWPALEISTAAIRLNAETGELRLTPPLPAYGNARVEFDPAQTMVGAAPSGGIDRTSRPDSGIAYLREVVLFCCELLGQPSIAMGGRFRPIAQLSADQNRLLAEILDGSRSLNGLQEFCLKFTGHPAPEPRRPPSLPALPAAPPPSISPSSSANPGAARETPPPLPGKSSSAPETGRPTDVIEVINAGAGTSNPLTRLRLLPSNSGDPMLAFAFGPGIRLGRAAEADFVAQFRPRTTANDTRTRLISRLQMELKPSHGDLIASETKGCNPSFIKEQPMTSEQPLALPATFRLAGEYGLEILEAPSDFAGEPPRIQNLDRTLPHGRRRGAVLVLPRERNILPFYLAWLFNDVSLGRDAAARLIFCRRPAEPGLARFHWWEGEIGLESLDESVEIEGQPLKPHQAVILTHDMRVNLGGRLFKVEAA